MPAVHVERLDVSAERLADPQAVQREQRDQRVTAAAANESLMRAQATAGFAEQVRLERLAQRRARVAEVLADVGAPDVEKRRATAVAMDLMSAAAGLPLVDIHGLSMAEASEAAAQAVAALVADLQSRASRRSRAR